MFRRGALSTTTKDTLALGPSLKMTDFSRDLDLGFSTNRHLCYASELIVGALELTLKGKSDDMYSANICLVDSKYCSFSLSTEISKI